jgi:hypothetical protein
VTEDDAWARERRLWLEGAEAFEALVADACVMAFAPVGLLTGAAIRAAVAGAPRWAEVSFEEAALERPDADTLVLGYRARGRRPDAAPYQAYCTSTYRRLAGGWRLVQHQQTPAG